MTQTFEEQFPSLKGKCFMSAIGECMDDDDNMIETSLEILKKSCLDKQKVSEVINRLIEENINNVTKTDLLEYLERELGL